MPKSVKYPPKFVSDLTQIIATTNTDSPNYMKGAQLVDLFNSIGFMDLYKFPEGIITPDLKENHNSRKIYTQERLSQLNDQYRLPEVFQAYIDFCNDKSLADSSIKQLLDTFDQAAKFLPQIDASAFKSQYEVGSVVIKEPQDTRKRPQPAVSRPYSVYDGISDGDIVIFISYSWGQDEAYRPWVKNFSNDLKERGYKVLIDFDLPYGADQNRFMIDGIDIATKVLVIGTPDYKEKFNKSSGGVAVEGTILTSELCSNLDTTKIVPILREGESYEVVFPTMISTKNGLDFRKEEDYQTQLDELCNDLNKHARQ